MSINSSFICNSSLNSSSHHWINFKDCVLINQVFTVTRTILLLPLSVLVLCLGHQQWRQKRSFATTSHSDIFAFNAAAMELLCLLGLALMFYDSFSDHQCMMTTVGYSLAVMSYFGHDFFHLLACVERYLAVVHPFIYLGLREARGVRIRNVSIGCVWLLSPVLASLLTRCGVYFIILLDLRTILLLSPHVFALVVVSFCSLSVLRVLMRPVPGDGGQNVGQVNQSKQKAFFTIAAITGVLWFWFLGFLITTALRTKLLSRIIDCEIWVAASHFSLPSSSLLPLLYLHRKGKPPCCHRR